MNIFEIKRLSEEKEPFYFDIKTMKSFGQTMRGWSIKKQNDGRFRISQPIMDRFIPNKIVGKSIRYFNPLTNDLENK